MGTNDSQKLSQQLINLLNNGDIANIAKKVREHPDRVLYVRSFERSISYYEGLVKKLISLVNIDKYNDGDLVYPVEDCLGNFYKDREYNLVDVDYGKQTAGICDGDFRLTTLDFDTLDKYFYKKF